MVELKEINEDLRKDVVNLIIENWGSPVIVTKGQTHHIDRLPGYVMIEDDRITGLITYDIKDNQSEIVSLDSFKENKGIGSRLLNKVIEKSQELGCSRVWLITTNDNTRAIKFYKRREFDICALHLNAVVEARKIKPEIPLFGYNNIPILHEIEFEKILYI